MTCTRVASLSSPLRTGLGLGLGLGLALGSLLALASAAPSAPLDSTTTSSPASTSSSASATSSTAASSDHPFSTPTSDDSFSTESSLHPSSDDSSSTPSSDDPFTTSSSDDSFSTLSSDDPSSTPSPDDPSPTQSSDDPAPNTLSNDSSSTLPSAPSPSPSSDLLSTTGPASSSASSNPSSTSSSDPSSSAPSAPSTSPATALTPPRPIVASSPTNATRKKPQLPRSVKVCSAKDPELDICFRESANKMLKFILPGSRRLGLVRLEPLLVPSVQLPRGNGLMPGLALNLSDSRQMGWARASLLDARAVPKNSRFAVTFQGHPEQRNTGRHLKLDNLSFESKFGRIHFDMKNLFGNEKMSNLTNALMNQHSQLLGEQAGPAVDLVFSELYQGLLQRFFDVMVLDDLFPDLPHNSL
ncbi:Protein of unknown function [Gryllus bimaculatus]|nr:Protein of unknown function [Gryllus bimaculatus]